MAKDTYTILWVYCMDCKKLMGAKNDHGQTGDSHGICSECYKIRLEELKAAK